MSHFAVLVIGEDVEGQLAPYDEEIQVAPYRELWEEKEIDRFEEHTGVSTANDSVEAVIEKMCEWNGSTNLYDAEVDAYYRLSTYNPNSRWDWYVVGGRWTGYFKVKQGESAMLGRPGVFDNEPTFDADVVLKGAVDFDGMREEAAKAANATYDQYEEAIEGIDLSTYRSWPTLLDEVDEGGFTIEEAREVYHDQEYMKALQKARLLPWMGDDPINLFASRESYVARCVNAVAVPYAVVRNGEWFAKGDMGWWGLSTDHITEDEWNERVQKLYDELPDDTLLTLVDCHI